MRLGIFTDAYKPLISGVVTSIDMLATGLKEMGHEVYIITTGYKGCPKSELTSDPYVIRFKGMDVPFMESFKGYQLIRTGRKKYFNKIKELNLDVIHAHTEFSIGRLALKVSKKLNIPMTYTMHTMYEDYMHHVIHHGTKVLKKPFMNYVIKWTSKFANASKEAIIPNKKVVDVFNRYGIKVPYSLIPTGIELNRFYKSNFKDEEIRELRHSYGIEDDDFVLINIGRVAPEKSLDMIINEFANDLRDYKAKLVIVGDGPAMKDIKPLVQSLNLEDKIILTGAQPWEMVPKFYQMGNLFVNASITETQGLTYIEALASGLPLLARYDKNLEEIIVDGENGLYFNNFEEFSNQTKKLLSDKELLEKLTNNASTSVKQFSKEEYARRVSELYERITTK